MEELAKKKTCLEIYTEIQKILDELNLEIVQNKEEYKLWTQQQRQLKRVAGYVKPSQAQDHFYSKISTHETNVSWNGYSIPVHVFEWFKYVNNWTIEQTADHIMHDPRAAAMKSVKFGNIGIREDLVNKINKRWHNWPLEIVSNPYWRSLPNAVSWSISEVDKVLLV